MIKDIYDIFHDERNKVYQIRSKTDLVIIEFDDEVKEKIFQEIIKFHQKNEFKSLALLSADFAIKFPKEKVLGVLDEMKDAGLLEDEKIKTRIIENQLKFWQRNAIVTGESFNEIQKKIVKCKLTLIGNGCALTMLKDKAKMSGFKNISVIEINKKLTNDILRKYVSMNDFLIAENDQWNPDILEKINLLAVEYNKPWLLIQGVDGFNASVGPLFLGKESGCYNCLINRVKSNKPLLKYFLSFEHYLKKESRSAKTDGAPVVIYDLISSVSILETIKYLTGFTIPGVYKKIITFDYYTLDTEHHHLLKSPGCEVCSPKVEFNPVPWLEPVTLQKQK